MPVPNDQVPLTSAVIANEFAAVQVRVARCGRGFRLVVQDLESGASVSLDPLDLRSFALASEDEQIGWLRSGAYRETTGQTVP